MPRGSATVVFAEQRLSQGLPGKVSTALSPWAAGSSTMGELVALMVDAAEHGEEISLVKLVALMRPSLPLMDVVPSLKMSTVQRSQSAM